MDKHLLGIVTIALTLVGYVPYFCSIFKRETKPHIFTWVVFSLTDGIAFVGQLSAGAGAGAWSNGVTSTLCLAVVAASFGGGEKNITRGDKIAFAAALAAIPLWLLTKNPFGALVIVSFINLIGSYPTFRKSYADPYGENLLAWSVAAVRAAIVLCAVERYSATTLIYPLGVFCVNAGVPLTLALRRRARSSALAGVKIFSK